MAEENRKRQLTKYTSLIAVKPSALAYTQDDADILGAQHALETQGIICREDGEPPAKFLRKDPEANFRPGKKNTKAPKERPCDVIVDLSNTLKSYLEKPRLQTPSPLTGVPMSASSVSVTDKELEITRLQNENLKLQLELAKFQAQQKN